MKIRIILRYAISILFIPGIMAGCSKSIVIRGSRPLTLPQNGHEVIQAQNQFAITLFKESLQADNSSSNKLISPISVYMDLSMACNGAAGATQNAIQNTLQLNHVSTDLLNNTNRALVSGIPKEDPHVQLNVANSIWYRNQGIQPLSSFLKTASDNYLAEVKGADFSPATVTLINNWVAKATNQKINSIIDQISSDDLMYLINAVYFKGIWKYTFSAKSTQNRPFYTSDGQTVQTPFMYQEGSFKYIVNDSAQIIELPYGSGDFNMYVMLPRQGISLNDLDNLIDLNTITQIINTKAIPLNIKLYLPKWRYSYEVKNMVPELNNMGMGVAFSPGADFSNMYPVSSGIYISKVIHKTYIAVDEQGTEAAAATAVGISLYSIGTNQAIVMDINRPFLYIIAEKNTGVVLFIGDVNNPALH